MEYVRPKLQLAKYKKKQLNILFRKIAQEIDHEMQTKLNFTFDYDLLLLLIRLMSLNSKYSIDMGLHNRCAVDKLIEDFMKIVSGNLSFNVYEKATAKNVYGINFLHCTAIYAIRKIYEKHVQCGQRRSRQPIYSHSENADVLYRPLHR